jgi:hypothetical protein
MAVRMLVSDSRTAIHLTVTATIHTPTIQPIILITDSGLIIIGRTMDMDTDIAAGITADIAAVTMVAIAAVTAAIAAVTADIAVVTADIAVDIMAVTVADMADRYRNSVRVKHLAYS